MKRNHQQPPKIMRIDALKQINESPAGIDIHLGEHWVSVPEDRDAQPVRRFGPFTRDLHAIADWLVHYGVNRSRVKRPGVCPGRST